MINHWSLPWIIDLFWSFIAGEGLFWVLDIGYPEAISCDHFRGHCFQHRQGILAEKRDRGPTVQLRPRKDVGVDEDGNLSCSPWCTQQVLTVVSLTWWCGVAWKYHSLLDCVRGYNTIGHDRTMFVDINICIYIYIHTLNTWWFEHMMTAAYSSGNGWRFTYYTRKVALATWVLCTSLSERASPQSLIWPIYWS